MGRHARAAAGQHLSAPGLWHSSCRSLISDRRGIRGNRGMLRRSTCTKGRADGKTFSVGIVAWWTAAIPLSAGLGVAVLPPGKATFTRKYYVGPAAVRLTKVIEKFEWVAVAASATLRLRATSSDQCACH